MSRARLTAKVICRFAALALMLSCVRADAAARDAPAASVTSIEVDRKSVQRVDGVGVTAPGKSRPEKRSLKIDDGLAPGTVIEIPDRTVVKLLTGNRTELTLQPGSRTRLNAVSARGESFTQFLGEAWFKVVRTLNFFEVTHDSFLAAVKGTEFKVAVDGPEIRFGWLAGQIRVSRQEKFAIEGTARTGAATLTEVVSEANPQVRYRLNVDEYLRTFKTFQDVEEYFRSQMEEDQGSGDPLRFSEGLTNLGTALVTIGNAKAAIGYYDQSLKLHLQLHPDGVHPEIAGDHDKLGIAYGDSGDHDKAIDSFQRSLQILRQLYPDGVHPQIAISYTNLGVEYGKIGDHHKAIGYFEQSLALLPKLYPDPDGAGTTVDSAMAANFGNLGGEYGKLKEPRKAIDYLNRSLALHRRIYPDGVHPDIAVDYLNLGVQYLYSRDLRMAIDSYDRSLALFLQLYPDGVHPAIAVVYKNLASAWRARGDATRADDYTRKQQDTEAKLKR